MHQLEKPFSHWTFLFAENEGRIHQFFTHDPSRLQEGQGTSARATPPAKGPTGEVWKSWKSENPREAPKSMGREKPESFQQKMVGKYWEIQ